ncbi:MAG: protein-glutamate O-methyltransferase CheR [Nitrospinota bacterium]|nr:protein-glutamate O-methyltransferase CheR [Nitrospinota bacterium]
MNDSYFGISINDKEFERFRDLIYRESGIKLRDNKKDLLRQRLNKRIRSLGLMSFSEYYKHVDEDRSRAELTELIDAVSTNVTSFFREMKHFEFLTKTALPQTFQRKKNGPFELRLWSAACSTGEEPYSMLFTLLEHEELTSKWNIKLLATDISTKVLQRAMKGAYPITKMDGMPNELLRKYFVTEGDNYVLKDKFRNMVNFRWFNLINNRFPFKHKFDVIFCRNVMIYFDKPTREELVHKFSAALAPGGYLCIGHSESLANTSHDLRYIQPTIYCKP